MTLVLASASPRRRALMRELGIEFESCVSDYEEIMDAATPADVLVCELALGKALAVAAARPGDIVVGADTFVAFNGEYFGKVSSEEEARSVLRRISDQPVLIYTGLAVVRDGEQSIHCVVTPASITTMDEEALNAYLAEGSYKDKSGAVGISIVENIEGAEDAVLGLPVALLREILKGFDGIS